MKSSVLLGQELQDELKELKSNPRVKQMLEELKQMGFSAYNEFNSFNKIQFCSAVNSRAAQLGVNGKTIGSVANAMSLLEEEGA